MKKRRNGYRRGTRRRVSIEDKLNFASELRKNPTKAEQVFYDELRRQIGEYPQQEWKFQVIVCGYIPDFYETTSRTVVELDGSVHRLASVRRNDVRKTRHLRKAGCQVIRLSNAEVLKAPALRVKCVLAEVHRTLSSKTNGTGTKGRRVSRNGNRQTECD